MTSKLLGVKEVAAQLGLSTKTIRRRFDRDELPGAFQSGGKGTQIKMPIDAIKKLKERK